MEDTKQEATHATRHQPRNINRLREAEVAASGFNTRLAVWLTEHVGTMVTAYLFAVIALIGLLGILGLLPSIAALLVSWVSQTFIQLVLLPIIMVGQNVLGRQAEMQADEAYKTTMQSYADIEAVMKHLDEQDKKIMELEQLVKGQAEIILSYVEGLAKHTTPESPKA